MSIAKKIQWHQFGSWAFLLLGLGHLLAYLFAPIPAELTILFKMMGDFVIPMPGSNSSVLLFYQGFSITMGVLLVGYGALNVLIAQLFNEEVLKIVRVISILNIVLAFLTFVLSLIFFFLIPIAFSLIALLSYSLFFITVCKKRPSFRRYSES